MPITRTLNTLLLTLALFTPCSSQGESLRIGSIADEYLSEVEQFKPLTNYLQSRLSAHGIDSVEIVMTNSMEKMANKILQNEVDLFIDSPYPAITVSQKSGSTMQLRRWKRGVDQYHSVIFVRSDHPATSIQDLEGQTIAFEEPFSTASYFLARSELLKHQITPIEAQENTPKRPGTIHYRFSGDDNTTISWVLRKRADAGTINHQKLERLKPSIRKRLRVIHQSPSVPRHIVSFSPQLSPERTDAIINTLTTMEENPAGQQALQQFEKTRRFDPIPAEIRESLEQLKQLIGSNPL